MSTGWVECWKCDECGHRWIKGEIWPTHCASSKCRKRSWNKNGGSLMDQAVNNAPAGAIAVELRGGPPDYPLVERRAIPDVKMNNAMSAFMDNLRLDDRVAPGEIRLGTHDGPILIENIGCSHKEWAEDGEQYRCSLLAGHKGKCRPGERIS